MVIKMKAIETALSLTQAYKLGIERFEKMLGAEFSKAIELMNKTNEHIIICGMGKSGLVGRKISSTLASTGTPSIFLHPAEAIHGDLGKVQKKSIVLLISYSGETGEIIALIPPLKRLDVIIVALTGVKDSTLASKSDIILDTSVDREACPLNLAPTTSTTMMLVLGDAIAVALMNKRRFKQESFKKFHPGGMLGKSLLLVKDIMHKKDKIPLIQNNHTMREVLLKMTSYGFGCVGITNNKNVLIGIVTDGDLRRNIAKNFLDLPIDKIMTKNPITIESKINIKNTVSIMNKNKITAVFVVKNNSKIPEGIIHIHDCIKTG